MRAGLHFSYVWMMLAFAPIMGVRVMFVLFALDLGAGAFEVGLVAAASQAPMLLLSIPVALAMDRYGARAVLTASTLCALLGVLLPWAFPAMASVLVGSLLFGLANVLSSQPLQKLMGMLSTPGTLARNFSRYMFLGATVGFLGPFAGGFAIDALGHASAMLIFLPLELTCLAMLAARGGMLPRAAREGEERGSLAQTLADRAVRRLMAVTSIAALGLELYPFFLPIYGHAAGLSATVIGGIVSVVAIGALLLPFGLARLVRALGEMRVLGLCLAGMSLAFLMLLPGANPWVLALSAFLFGFASCAVIPVSAMLAFNRLPALRAGQFLGVRNTGNAAVRVVAPPVFGALAALLGLPAVFVAAALIMGAAGAWVRRQAG